MIAFKVLIPLLLYYFCENENFSVFIFITKTKAR